MSDAGIGADCVSGGVSVIYYTPAWSATDSVLGFISGIMVGFFGESTPQE